MSTHPLRRARAWLGCISLCFLTLGATATQAQEDPPGRVGRLADVQGGVSWFDHEQGSWSEAERNRPLTSGDRVSTSPQGRAEVRVGSTVLRLAAATELEVLRLDDQRMSFQLHAGSLALRVRSREVAGDIDVRTAEVRLRPERAGHYRIDRIDDSTQAGAWRGTLRIDDAEGFIIETGQRVELWREGRERRSLKFAWTTPPNDDFAQWAARDDQRDERSASSRYVSPEMTGAEDLDRSGRWERHPEYGAIWYPLEVRAGWAPYRYGSWAWVRPWGWTWVDEAPWGFAPFHYGRWVSWGGRWGWCPGDYVARPVYSPALVAWVGGPSLSVSVRIGGPSVGWVPLAPREWYTPYHPYSPGYGERINPRPPGYRGDWQRPPQQVPTGPVMYGNQGVPGAVTVVPRDVLVQRQPVGRNVIDQVEVHRALGQQPLPTQAPPAREPQAPRSTPAPGAWQPVPAPERATERARERASERASERDERREQGRDQGRDPGRDSGRDSGRPVDPRRAPERDMGPRPAPQAAPAGPAIDQRRDRVPSTGPGAAPTATPNGTPTVAPNAAPPARAPAAQGQPPAAVAPRPPAGPPIAAPAAAPPAAATVPPTQPRAAPTSPPERAAERAREQAAKDEDRKRGPDNRGRERDRENPRERENQR